MPQQRGSFSSSSPQRGRGGRRGRGRGQRSNHSSINSSSKWSTPRQITKKPTPRVSNCPSSPNRSSSSPGVGSRARTTTPSSSPTLSQPPGSIPGDQNVRANENAEPILHETIMAIDMRERSTIGCAYFSTSDGTLYLSEDIPMATTDIAEQFLIHVQPSTLLISARAPEGFYQFLEKQCTAPSGGDSPGEIVLRGIQSSEFSAESAHERLINLHAEFSAHAQVIFPVSTENGPLDGIGDHSDGVLRQESWVFRSLRCGGSVNLGSLVSVGCAGAVLGDLRRRRSAGFLPDGQAAGALFRVQSVEMFSLSTYMFVSSEALLSLQIVQTELHPNSQVWGSNPNKGQFKESLSVYGLFHYLVCTPQGRAQLRQVFLRPVLDIGLIEERQRSIAALLRPDNADNLARITSCLRKIKNLRLTFAQVRKGIEYPTANQSFDRGVWSTIQNFTAQTLNLREAVASLKGCTNVEIVCKLLDNLPPLDLLSVGEMINKTIDFEESKSRHRSSVKNGIDPQLDELKRTYDGMDSLLTQVVNHMSRELPEWACQYVRSCIFLPQIGFLTVVEPNPGTGNGMYEGEGAEGSAWEKLFSVEGAVCYKNNYMQELDKEYGDMYCQIGDREVEIIHDLANRVLNYEDALVSASDVCGEFDAILALALGADKYGWRAPKVVEASEIQIEGGRHPLQELVVPAFVANDCHLESGAPKSRHDRGNFPQVLVLTGPNHSGKSVYLKQVAIIVYLAHIGSFVPANQAIIGLTDKILTCISTKESMSGAESAFATDMKQAALSTRCSTPKSLVLVDEFGKGTNADDGPGLLGALLDYFLSSKQDSPRILVATHYHEIFEGGYLKQHEGLQLAHLDVRVDWSVPQAEDQVTYLFSLAYGHSTSSFGAKCAALNGVPSAVVERAEAISLLLARNEDLEAVCTRLSPVEEKQLDEAEKTARKFLQQVFREVSGNVGKHDGNSMKKLLENLISSEATCFAPS